MKSTTSFFISALLFYASVLQASSSNPNPPHQELVACDQLDQTIKIYDTKGRILWKWSSYSDDTIPAAAKADFAHNVAEAKPLNGGRQIAMVTCGGCWAILDRQSCKAVAWGLNQGWTHTIEVLPDDTVCVAATGGKGGSAVFLYDIKGEKALQPKMQNAARFQFQNPHGLHWDGERLWVLDDPGLHQCKIGRETDGRFTLERCKSWFFNEVADTDSGHDLRPIPGTDILVLSTNEMILFFDIAKKQWLKERSLNWRIAKGVDPCADGSLFLVTTATKKWWTDTLRLYDPTRNLVNKQCPILFTVPNARFYKARWIK